MAEAESTDESSTLLGTSILPESAGSKKPSCQPSGSFVVVPPPPLKERYRRDPYSVSGQSNDGLDDYF
jgi:hypothetical protein